MHIFVTNPTEITVSQFDQEGIEIELANESLYFGAMPMFVASLARCTFAVLESYSMRLDIDANEIQIKLIWEYAKKPTRISAIDMQILWAVLPESRLKAVSKAAHLCTIHNTINQCVDVNTSVVLNF